MSRFNNLELDGSFDDQARGANRAKDESFFLGEAQTAFRNGDFEAALRAFARVLEYNPDSTAAWSGQVRMLIELGEFHEAKLWADKALERFPHEPDLLAAKAVALARQGDDLEAALAFSDASIAECGNSPYAWLARGDVLLARKEKRADYCFEKALLFAPAEWLWQWLAARIRYFHQQFSLALKHAQEAVNFAATEAVTWLQLGLCQQALGLSPSAQVSFTQVLQLNPHSRAAARALRELKANPGRPGGFFRRFFSS